MLDGLLSTSLLPRSAPRCTATLRRNLISPSPDLPSTLRISSPVTFAYQLLYLYTIRPSATSCNTSRPPLSRKKTKCDDPNIADAHQRCGQHCLDASRGPRRMYMDLFAFHIKSLGTILNEGDICRCGSLIWLAGFRKSRFLEHAI